MAKKSKSPPVPAWAAAIRSGRQVRDRQWGDSVREAEKDPAYQDQLEAIEAFKAWEAEALAWLDAIPLPKPNKGGLTEEYKAAERDYRDARAARIAALQAEAEAEVANFPAAPLKKKRTLFDRDHEWLRQYEAAGEPTYHSHARIRDKWNADHSRDPVERETVKKGIQKAKRERENDGGQEKLSPVSPVLSPVFRG